MEKTTAKHVLVNTECVNVTKQVKAMMRKANPKIHHYRVDAIACAEILVELFEDKFSEKIKVTLNEGYAVKSADDSKPTETITINTDTDGTQVLILNSVGALFKALLNIQAPEEAVAKYAKPKKCKVTVDELLDNTNISDTLKAMLAKEIDNL